MIIWTDEQLAAFPKFTDWYRRWVDRVPGTNPGFIIMGLGGTGKTVLAEHLIREAGLKPEEVVGGALQASVAEHLEAASGFVSHTLHSLVYRVEARVGMPVSFVVNQESRLKKFKLLVIDEISQVPLDLWRDVVSLGVPILVLGDHGQLRAISGASIVDSLIPDVVLTKLQRTEASNPISYWSHAVRAGYEIPFGEYHHAETGETSMRKIPLSQLDWNHYLDADVILVGKHTTRHGINAAHRARLGFTSPLPQVGEPLYCRNKNQQAYGIKNSNTGHVLAAGKDTGRHAYSMTFQLHETGIIVPERKCRKLELGWDTGPCPDFIGRDLSDIAYGYSRTVPSFIGRQADNVVLIAEWRGDEGNNWLYTGMSRARKTLTIVVP